jgi:hypothetical protein
MRDGLRTVRADTHFAYAELILSAPVGLPRFNRKYASPLPYNKYRTGCGAVG